MRTIDLRGDLKRFYAPRLGALELIEVPAFQFLMVDGQVAAGERPGESAGFQADVGALYGAVYTLKFAFKKREVDPVDFPVMALEGLWPADIAGFEGARLEPWAYTLMIMEPDMVTPADLAAAVGAVRTKRGPNPALDRLRLERFEEGLCVQALHVGPYATEPATIDRMRAFMAAEGLRPRGRHHEIYLGDPRRADPAKLMTVLRQPVTQDARGAGATGADGSQPTGVPQSVNQRTIPSPIEKWAESIE